MRAVRFVFSTLVLIGLTATLAAAQAVSATTGAINGRVTDNTGAILPGVTVTLSSPAMMGTRTVVTTTEGQYRFPAIPPGVYQLTYELAGFGTIRRDEIRVTLGFTATVNVELGVASLQESVTVTGESPVVDTQSTSITTNFDAKQLANLPSARDLWAILAESPGVQMNRIDVGGSAAGTQTGYVTYGTTGQNRPTVEGIVATEGTDAAGFYYDYGSFDEVAVNAAAHSAEMPWPGVQSNFISKSGGNEFHGTFYGDYENESIQARNTDDDQIARGLTAAGGLQPSDLNRLFKYHDVNVGAGGRITRDRLWWYGSFRDQYVSARIPNFPVKPHPTRLTNYGGKGTYNLSTNNKLIAYAQAGRKHQPLRQDSFLLGNTVGINVNEDSTWEQLYWGWVWKGEWNAVVNDQTFFEVRAGQFGYNWPNHPNGTGPRFEDTGNNIITGGNRDWNRDRRRDQVLGSLSYFKDGWGGDHNFKVGGEIFRETTVDTWLDGYPGDVLHRLNNGVPTDVYLFEPGEGIVGLWTYAAFVNDTWRVGNRLSLNLGLRFDKYGGFLPEQEHPVSRFNAVAISFPAQDDVFSWNLFSPRAGVTYDIAGNGRTVVKLNYGQYLVEPRGRLPVQRESQCERWVEQALRLDRPHPGDDTCHQREWCVGSWRAGLYGDWMHRAAGRDERWRSHGVARSESGRHLHAGARWLVRTGAVRELRRPHRVRVARPTAAVPASEHIPVLRELHRAGHRSRSRTGQRGGEQRRWTCDLGVQFGPGVRGTHQQRAEECAELRQRLLHVGGYRHQALQQPLVAARELRTHVGERVLERLLWQYGSPE